MIPTTQRWELAQVNVARLLAPLDDPLLAGFVNGLDPINAIADAADGFVWRLQTDEGDATALRVFPDPDVIVNLSMWSSIESLKAFAFGVDHVAILRQRRHWFEPPTEPHLALWWVPAGEQPSLDETKRRLEFLRRHGPSPFAFTFNHPQPPVATRRASLSEPIVQTFIEELNAELMAGDPEGQHFFGLGEDDIQPGQGALLVMELDGEAVGCGAVRLLAPGLAELKRMYLRPSVRGRKLGAVVVDALEHEARRIGVDRLQLETGLFLEAAVRVYERSGFVPIERYGEYVDSPDSYCMGKDLT